MKPTLFNLCCSLPILIGFVSAAQALDLICEGLNPDWQISTADDTATFTYGRNFEFEIPQRNDAENREWPKAMTLIEVEQRHTAILVVDKKTCTTAYGDYSLSAYVLTQRASTPILLAGCCTVQE